MAHVRYACVCRRSFAAVPAYEAAAVRAAQVAGVLCYANGLLSLLKSLPLPTPDRCARVRCVSPTALRPQLLKIGQIVTPTAAVKPMIS